MQGILSAYIRGKIGDRATPEANIRLEKDEQAKRLSLELTLGASPEKSLMIAADLDVLDGMNLHANVETSSGLELAALSVKSGEGELVANLDLGPGVVNSRPKKVALVFTCDGESVTSAEFVVREGPEGAPMGARVRRSTGTGGSFQGSVFGPSFGEFEMGIGEDGKRTGVLFLKTDSALHKMTYLFRCFLYASLNVVLA